MKSLVAKLTIVASVLLIAATAPLSTRPSQKKVTYAQYVHAKITDILDTVQADSDYPIAISSLRSLFDQAILYAPPDKIDLIHDTDYALRLVTQLSRVPNPRRDDMLPWLRKHPELAQTLVFLIRPDEQKPAGAYAVLDHLRQERADKVDTFATLAAALCVVQDRRFSRGINENTVKSIDPLEIFDYYVANENRMYFGIRNVPAELLLYVVDTTATVDEMNWALRKYGGNSKVGAAFFDVPYDYEYLKRGSGKKVDQMGYNLPNLLKYGGVCVDQAYFATTVGKAIGVPTAIDGGQSAEAGHAWAGFLQFNGRTATWNFDSGRYEAFQGVRGSVLDPQSRSSMPDSYVSLLAEIIGTRAINRQNTVALTDAAHRLDTKGSVPLLSAADAAPPVDTLIAGTFRPKPRATDVPAQLDLIEQALSQSIAYAPAWATVRDLAVEKKLTLADKDRWSGVLLKLGAAKYPDFTLEILLPMVKTIDDPQQQDALLSKMLPLFASRSDLSASILMAQAKLWEANDQPQRAGNCYMQVVDRYVNSGPFVIGALAGAEKLLKQNNRAEQIAQMYGQAWSRTQKPDQMAPQFMDQSNWFRIGKLFAMKLEQEGETAKAGDVNLKLGIGT